MTEQTKHMIVRDIDTLNLPPETSDTLSRALKVYHMGASSYSVPVTLGKPKDKKATMAMDACVNHMVSTFQSEWAQMAVPRFLGYATLANISQDPLIRAGIETICDDMTRKFIELTTKGEIDLADKIATIESDMQSFRVKSIFNKALATTGYMGGCLVYIDVGQLDDEEKKTPLFLDKKTFRKGAFKGFRIIEPINVYPGYYNTDDPTDKSYFKPETWFVLGKEYHASRFLYFAQNDLPIILKPLYNFFGMSLSQQVLEYVHNFTENRRSAQRLLNKFSLTIWKTDMSQFLNGGTCDDIIQRVKFFNRQRSNDGTAVLNNETEDMIQLNTPLAGVTDIVSMSLDLAPVILGISKDKYFGDLPKGLNASSEGTNRIYYDKILSLNEKICYDNIETMIKVLQLNRFGEIDENISFRFAPLWEMDERERAEINKVKADTAAVYLDRGALSAEEVRGSLAENPDSGFSNIDVDDVPETDDFADVDMDDKDEAGSVFDGALALDAWNEQDHPRDDDGKFSEVAGSGNKTDEKSKETLSESIGEHLKKKLTTKLSREAMGKSISSRGKQGAGYMESGGESVNASIARSDGLATAKDIASELKKMGYDIGEEDIPDLLDISEWHHTGKSFKKTNFYDPSEIDEDELKRISDRNKKQKKEKIAEKDTAKYMGWKDLEDDSLYEKYKEVTGEKYGSFEMTKMMFGGSKKKARDYLISFMVDEVKKNPEKFKQAGKDFVAEKKTDAKSVSAAKKDFIEEKDEERGGKPYSQVIPKENENSIDYEYKSEYSTERKYDRREIKWRTGEQEPVLSKIRSQLSTKDFNEGGGICFVDGRRYRYMLDDDGEPIVIIRGKKKNAK